MGFDHQEINNAEDDGEDDQCDQGDDANEQRLISLPEEVKLHLKGEISAGWRDTWDARC